MVDSTGPNYGQPATEELMTELTTTVANTATTETTDTSEYSLQDYTGTDEAPINESGFRVYQNVANGEKLMIFLCYVF